MLNKRYGFMRMLFVTLCVTGFRQLMAPLKIIAWEVRFYRQNHLIVCAASLLVKR